MKSVVFLSIDCLRADHVGCYGYDRPTTPHIDRFAEQATRFVNSYANSPGTRWAFQSIHSGRSMRYLDGEGLPDSGDTVLAEAFQQMNYATAGFAYNALTSREWNYHRGFDEFGSVQEYAADEAVSQKLADVVSEKISSDRLLNLLGRAYDAARPYLESQGGKYKQNVTDKKVVEDALEFLKSVPEDKPYFLWVHLMNAHTPYSRWDDHLEAIRGDTDVEHVIDPNNSEIVTEGQEPGQAAIDAYDGGVRSADEQVGRILEAIGDEETIVITGDHGEEFGRYGGFHQMSLYSSMTQVPIIVRDAELESGTQESPAQHIDIPATLAYGADIDIPKHWHQTPLQSHKRSLDDPIFFDIGARTTGVRAGQFKYITNRAEGYVELYNTPHMSADGPDVSNDYPEKCRELKEMIDSYLETVLPQAKKTGRMPFEGSQEQLKMDDRVEETLKELGYL